MKVFLTTALDGGGYLLVPHIGCFLRVDEFQRFSGNILADVIGREKSHATARN
jgi:hypothetical protein